MGKQKKHFKARIKEVKRVKNDIFLLNFSSAYLAKTARPGNFLHIKNEATILRRPLSIHRIKNNLIYILFKVRGRGTEALAKKRRGGQLDIIGPLGNGFKLERDKRSILVAGGIGVAPLLFLAEQLLKSRQPETIVLLGAKSKREIVCRKDFKDLGLKARVATEDGSAGQKGFVTDLLKNQLRALDPELEANIYACGPKDMFFQINKIIKGQKKVNSQVSFEQFMGCGVGVCCACVILTKFGYKKVCQDGPVFNLKDIY